MNKLSKQRPEIITITDKALTRIKSILEKAPKNTLGVRFGVKTGGCSGMTYDVTYASEEKVTDEKIVKDNINIYIDASATLFLIGSEVDWNQDKLESSFSFNNPNESARCGCGESFTV
ncbi:iron-sulfur cluster assembly accessory protein [Alphaproteobacteria bacterium]|nr:iron-sulfur cluster assembly accessory protein [Alphaproteobacteria bacterium]